jgi:hypothetical protein
VAKLDERLDSEERRLRQLTEDAGAAAIKLVGNVAEWTGANGLLSKPTAAAPYGGEDHAADTEIWDSADIEALRNAEPGQVLNAADGFAGIASVRANTWAGRLHADARADDQRAGGLHSEAAERRAEAADLRAGKLLPLPRPDWAGVGEDDDALGSAIDWRPSFDPAARPALEAALSVAGLLGATLTSSGVRTSAWRVGPYDPPVAQALAAVLTVDPDHPLAANANAVLQRIALADSAASSAHGTALVIGRDGTFRTGVAAGAPALASATGSWPPAQHVGARQRRAAAFARADQLDNEASELESQAQHAAGRAEASRQEAGEILRAASIFPSRETLRTAEAGRAAKALDVAELSREMEAAAEAARERRREHQQLREDWTERTRARGLPIVLDELTAVEMASRGAARTLRTSAGELADRFAPRLSRLRAMVACDDSDRRLPELLSRSRAAATRAAETQSRMEALSEKAGAAIDEVLENHRQMKQQMEEVTEQLGPADAERERLGNEVVKLTEQLRTAAERVDEALPLAERRMRELTGLVDVPGVVESVFSGTRPSADHLLADVTAGLARAKSYTKKTLRDRYDEARARLAGSWALGSGDPMGELDTYVFSYGDGSFTPARAAAQAMALADRAEAALAAAEEKALRDFVVGMLPSAIRTGWVRMHDWVKEVNRKMRSAAASSQLSVQVRLSLASDLPEHTRMVYELACKVFEADRTADQNVAVGHALQALISASDGDTMTDKVSAAVNIGEWADLVYEIHRPDGTTVNWTPRTGLSGGERRLAALDEVPAEVDEQGREGLARYIATLDLDLICTSYLWDGAPGAWDGIDAWDLESAADATVVGFPMLVRGLVPLHGDVIGTPGLT